MLVLGIETSCDETAAALVRDDGSVLSDVVASQMDEHAPFGGIVPELASRAHLRNAASVITEALAPLDGDLSAIDAVAVTQGPGLVGALLVGVQLGKGIALAQQVPLLGVSHLVGHLLAVHLRHDAAVSPPDYPYVALLVSGGHTALYLVRSPTDIEQLGQTRDDAAGEAYDKVAKLLGLGYPGGPVVDRLAAQGDAKRFALPRPLLRGDSLDFSFSGLKTAVSRLLVEHADGRDEAFVRDVCAAFQHVVVDVLVRKSLTACTQREVPRLVLAGGVAANRGLRARAAKACERAGVALHVPPPQACTDNAAMIAYVGTCRMRTAQQGDALALDVFSRSPVLGAPEDSPARRRYRSSKLPRTRTNKA
jgi:N6-L-threonylcarbamoyladenine synthase